MTISESQHGGLAAPYKNHIEWSCAVAIILTWSYIDICSLVNGNGSEFYRAIQGTWISSAVLGCGFIWLTDLKKKWKFYGAACAAVLSAVALLILPNVFRNYIQSFAFCVSIMAGSMQATLFASEGGSRRWDRGRILVRGVALVGGVALGEIHGQSLRLLNPTYDAAMFNFDQHLLLRVPVAIDNFLGQVPALGYFVVVSYQNIPAAIGAYDGLFGRRSPGLSMTAIFLLSGYIGYFCYNIIPVAGPQYFDLMYSRHLFGDDLFVTHGTSYLKIGIARNCMPSLHATWAYMFLLNLHALRNTAARAVLGAFAILTILGALTAGGHWFLDIVIAIPFAACLNGLTGHFQPRSALRTCIATFGGAAIVAIWFFMILNSSFANMYATPAWASVVATVFCSGILLLISGQLLPVTSAPRCLIADRDEPARSSIVIKN